MHRAASKGEVSQAGVALPPPAPRVRMCFAFFFSIIFFIFFIAFKLAAHASAGLTFN